MKERLEEIFGLGPKKSSELVPEKPQGGLPGLLPGEWEMAAGYFKLEERDAWQKRADKILTGFPKCREVRQDVHLLFDQYENDFIQAGGDREKELQAGANLARKIITLRNSFNEGTTAQKEVDRLLKLLIKRGQVRLQETKQPLIPTPKLAAADREPPKETPNLHIEIGNSPYLLSKEAQRYIRVKYSSDYGKSRSVLIINEPHGDREGQFSLYKGLAIFFRDNPTAVSKTLFLAEGFPANQPISVESLIEVEPNPDDEVIREVLNTFLITGYMAYEWKYQRGIPIIGTENPLLYQLASRLRLSSTEEEGFLLDLAIVARNRSMAVTLVEQAKRYENPILFTGADHLTDHISNKNLQKLKSINLGTFLPPEEIEALKDFKNLGVDDYLKKEKLGYTFLVPRLTMKGLRIDRDFYERIFRIQQTGDYSEYIEELLSEKTPYVTTRPSPEAAAKFLKKFRKIPPGNPEAVAASDRGFSLASKGKFIDAAQEFSAASAAEPGNCGFVRYVQDSLFDERDLRISYILRPNGKISTIKPSIESDLPVIGPYIKKDHRERVTEFAKRFAQTPGLNKTVDNATAFFHWESRFGAALQIDVAQILGPEKIRAFEEKHGKGRVDIATKDNIAIECKNFGSLWVRLEEIERWVEQAVSRFEPDEKGHQYNRVLIVIPNHGNLEEIQLTVNVYLELKNPKLLGKIKVSKVADVRESLYRLTKK